MLTIVDLKRDEELSRSEAANVAGGMSCDQKGALIHDLLALGSAFGSLGCYGANKALNKQAEGVASQQSCEHGLFD